MGCPVIASISGVDMVLIVAEPSLSGINDMKIIVNTGNVFGNKISVCVNKYGTNLENTDKIQKICMGKEINFVGKIPYDICAVNPMNQGKTIVDFDCESAVAVEDVYKNVIGLI